MNAIAHAQTSNGERVDSPASALRRLVASVLDLGVMVLIHFTIAGRRWAYTAVLYAFYHTICIAVGAATIGKAVMGLIRGNQDARRCLHRILRLSRSADRQHAPDSGCIPTRNVHSGHLGRVSTVPTR